VTLAEALHGLSAIAGLSSIIYLISRGRYWFACDVKSCCTITLPVESSVFTLFMMFSNLYTTNSSLINMLGFGASSWSQGHIQPTLASVLASVMSSASISRPNTTHLGLGLGLSHMSSASISRPNATDFGLSLGLSYMSSALSWTRLDYKFFQQSITHLHITIYGAGESLSNTETSTHLHVHWTYCKFVYCVTREYLIKPWEDDWQNRTNHTTTQQTSFLYMIYLHTTMATILATTSTL